MNSDISAMIPLDARLSAFVQLGAVLVTAGEGEPWPGHQCGVTEQEYEDFIVALDQAYLKNAWFTPENVRYMTRSLGAMLTADRLGAWLASYGPPEAPAMRRTVGVITAGNVPLVGFHDILCVLLSGHRLELKLSSDDAGLTQAVLKMVEALSPDLVASVRVAQGRLGAVEALIATGSNNTARYFEHYFSHVPRIVRKSRTSVALLDGSETEEELAGLGDDLFRYFGLGCRNVSKVFIPRDFDLDRIFAAILPWGSIAQHNKWCNNYEYHKAIWMMDQVPLLENGFVLFKEDTALHSPLGSVYYERYDEIGTVLARIEEAKKELQCIVGHGHVPFGDAQCPRLEDHADGVDTMAFLAAL